MPIGTHAPVWTDSRVALIVAAIGVVGSLGVSALAHSGERDDLDGALAPGAKIALMQHVACVCNTCMISTISKSWA